MTADTDKSFDRGGYRPPRNYSWPDATEGNTLALKSGAWSERKVVAEIERLSPELAQEIEDVGYLSDPSYGAALRAWIRAESRVNLLEAWFADKGLLDPEGVPHRGVETLLRAEAHAARCRSRLGLDPVSRVQLQKDLTESGRNTVDMAQALAEGRRLRLAAEKRLANGETTT